MKLALLFSGRINDNKEQYENMINNIVGDNECDIFVSYSKTDSRINKKCSISKFMELYKPKKIIENDEKYNDISLYSKNGYSNTHNIMCMYLNRLNVLNLFKEYISINGNDYDIIISIRCDLWYDSKLNIELNNKINIPNPEHDWGGMNDQLAYGNYENMKIYLKLFTKIYEILDDGYVIHPETILSTYLKNEKVDIKRFQLYYFIKRDL